MNDHDALLNAIGEHPEEDTPRLMYADWLDENDQPARAEFVRLQIELARGVPDRDRLRQLELRQRDLLVAHDTKWVSPLAAVLKCEPGQWGGWVFRRGFVEYFHLPAAVVVKRGAKLAKLTPVRELFLRQCHTKALVALCAQPWTASLTHLYLEGVYLTPITSLALLDSPHLKNLRVVRYAGSSMPETRAEEFRRRFTKG